MSKEIRDLQDCIDEAKKSLVEHLDGGANYLRRHGQDDTVSDLIVGCAGRAVPVYNSDLLDVFESDSGLWYIEPDGGFKGAHSIIGTIRRAIYNAIGDALGEYADDLEGDALMCEADDCDEEDDHGDGGEPPRCKAHCDPDICAECGDDAEAKSDGSGSCSSCGKPPETFVDGDCFDCNPPVSAEGRITHAECGCPIGKGHVYQRTDTGQQGMLPYVVGESAAVIGMMRRFATELAAVAYIGTLPGHADGRYCLDGPIDEEAE